MERTVDTSKQCGQLQQCGQSQCAGADSAQQTPVARARLHPMLQLQRKAGNQAVLALLRSGVNHPPLTVGSPDDLEEMEADRIAGVTHSQVPQNHPAVVQRSSPHPSNQTGGGLPPPVAELMERHFSTSFADVTIHAGDSGARAAAERGAAAFTKGSDIYFGHGHFQPSTDRGRHLIAHELAHVVQQRNGRDRPSGEPASAQTSRLELEADQAAAALPSSLAGIAKGRVVNKASFGSEQMSLLGDVVELKAAIGGGIRSAARWVLAHATDDPLVMELGQLLDDVSAMKVIRLPRPVIEQMEKMLAWARSVAPSWLPVPAIDFRGDGAQGVAGVDDVAVLAVILLLAFLLVFVWLLLRLNPATRKAQDEAIEEMIRKIKEGLKRKPEPEEKPEPEPKPEPDEPRPPIPVCPFPTGLSMADPIPIAWHKIASLYPSPIRLADADYARDTPTSLPHGEPVGVPQRFWPRFGKIVQLIPDRRGTAARDFRAVLDSYGFDWGGRRYLQADHVQDVQWGTPDGEPLDVFNNLWPYDGAANVSAGPTQNQFQPVTFCESVAGPANISVPVQSVKRPGGYGRYFVITRIGFS